MLSVLLSALLSTHRWQHLWSPMPQVNISRNPPLCVGSTFDAHCITRAFYAEPLNGSFLDESQSWSWLNSVVMAQHHPMSEDSVARNFIHIKDVGIWYAHKLGPAYFCSWISIVSDWPGRNSRHTMWLVWTQTWCEIASIYIQCSGVYKMPCHALLPHNSLTTLLWLYSIHSCWLHSVVSLPIHKQGVVGVAFRAKHVELPQILGSLWQEFGLNRVKKNTKIIINWPLVAHQLQD